MATEAAAAEAVGWEWQDPRRNRPRVVRALYGLGNFCRKKKVGAFGLVISLFMVVMAIIGPSVAPYGVVEAFEKPNPKYDANSFEPEALNPSSPARLDGPSWDHPFGTDGSSYDMFSRMLHGARLSLQVGIFASFFATVLGSLIGIVSGYLGGLVDLVVQRFVDAAIAIPGIVFLLLLVQTAEPSKTITITALAVLGTFGASRVVRSATLAVRNDVYIEAARSIGARPNRIMAQHVLPNILAPIFVIFTIQIGGNILAEAGLAFLGLGVPGPSWGAMVNDGRQVLETDPHVTLFSGGAITLTVLAFNLLGDALRDVFDPRQRGSR